MKTRRISFILILSIILLMSGCAHEEAGIRPAKEIYKEAEELAADGKVEKATEKFMEVRTYYPADELARAALLATADLNYNNELYEPALQSYEEFRLLYPTDDSAGYALYRIGLCHFNQINDYDRDQLTTIKSIQAFDNFISSYPNSQLVQAARDNLTEAKTVIAKHYIYIGKFYLKKKDYKGACNRFQYVKKNYPDIHLEDDVDSLISRSCTKAEEQKKP